MLKPIPRDLVETLRIEARHAASPPTQLVVAFDGGREVHQPAPDQDMADLLTEAADEIERRRACWCYHAGAGEWRPINTVPKDRYFLAYVMPRKAEAKLRMQLGFPAPGGEIIVAHRYPKDKAGIVRSVPRGTLETAIGWMPLPAPPKVDGGRDD